MGKCCEEKGRPAGDDLVQRMMETSFALSSQESHVRGRRLSEGELVEVRQQEKGLRGSWHPAVVIAVKAGRRVVEYEELLTDDGQEKLIEIITVGRCRHGERVPAARQSWNPGAQSSRVLLRPRPPPLPEPSSISWSKGLSVDCYSQDAWWEGVLTEAINSSSRNKRAVVWFPEEEDWEAMLVKNMRVGQRWDEETDTWSLTGCVDVPASKLKGQGKNLSYSRVGAKGILRRQVGWSLHGEKLATALIGNEVVDYASAWISTNNKIEDATAEISVQLNSPRKTAITQQQSKSGGEAATNRSFELLSGRPLVTALETLDSLSSTRLSGIAGWNPVTILSLGGSSVVGKTDSHYTEPTVLNILQRGLANGGSTLHVGETIDRMHLGVDDQPMSITATRKNAETEDFVNDDDDCRQLLLDAGWNVGQTQQKNGKFQWYYRSPNGCLLGSLASAMGIWRQMSDVKDFSSSDNENPTLNDMRSSKFWRSSNFGRCNSGNVRISKESRQVFPVKKWKEARAETREIEVALVEHVALETPTRSPDRSDITHAPSSDCKRNAWTSDVVADSVDFIDLKRRKLLDHVIGQSELGGLHVSLSRGLATEGTDGVGACLVPRHMQTDNHCKQVDVESTSDIDDSDVVLPQIGMKKRSCLAEDLKPDDSTVVSNKKSREGRSLNYDSATDLELRSKKRRVMLNELCSPSGGKNRTSIAILQDSSRKKASFPSKGCGVKQVIKSGYHAKKGIANVRKGKKSRLPGRRVRLEVVLSSPGTNRDFGLGEGEVAKKRTLLSWLIDNGKVVEYEKVRYLHRKDLHCMLEGLVTRDGILCGCCKKVVTLSVFEAHAGSKLHRPSANIFLDDGRSLSMCQMEALALKAKIESDLQQVLVDTGPAVDKSDDTCGFCGDGGILILCDHCPSTYHLSCMGLQGIPDGDWYCPNCRCGSCGGSQFNADRTTFNDLTVIFCEQCEFEYHVKCLRARGLVLGTIPQDDFFCGDSCERIFRGLRSLVGVCKGAEDGFSWTLLRSVADDYPRTGCVPNLEINAEYDSKLSIALSVMQECFRPMVDPRTKIDIISHVLYNRRSDVSRLNYHGFYTMLLERGDELISVATIRVHGSTLAEMPLIGTRFQYRRQGMCRRLMGVLEEMLKALGVKQLVLPAVPDLLDTWIGAFGFKPMNERQRLQLMDMNIMAFPETSILYKVLEKAEPWAAECPSTAHHSSHTEVVQSGLIKSCSGLPGMPALPTAKRGRGRPPKIKVEMDTCHNGLECVSKLGTEMLSEASHIVLPPSCRVACNHLHVKRGRGRPPKNKETGHIQTEPRAADFAGGQEIAGTRHKKGYMCSIVAECVTGKGLEFARQFKSNFTQQEVGPVAFQSRQSHPRGIEGHFQYLSNMGTLSSKSGAGLDQWTLLHRGHKEECTTQRDTESKDPDLSLLQRLLKQKLILHESGIDDFFNSTVVRETTQDMQKVRVPLWLVHGEAKALGTFSRQERRGKTYALEGNCQACIPALESSISGSTKTYARRKRKLSPLYNNELLSSLKGHFSEKALAFAGDPDVEAAAVPEPQCSAVLVPIRTFPSRFWSQGDDGISPKTLIPVETSVINTCQSVEPLHELQASDKKWIDVSYSWKQEGTLPPPMWKLSKSRMRLKALTQAFEAAIN